MVCLSPRIRDRLPDGSHPEALRERATAAQVRDAIQTYGERARFRVELGVRVMAAEADGATVRLRTTAGELLTGALVVATGEFSSPRIPRELPIGFEGAIQHSSEFRASDVLPGERVVVIGAGNSGAEVALAASEAGARVTVCAGAPVERPRWEPQGVLYQELAWLASGLPVGALPRRGGCRARVPLASDALWEAGRRGRVRIVGRALAVEARVVRLASGEVCAADRVVLATGFRRELQFLGDAIRLDADGLPLHRGGISTDMAGVAFMGLPCMRTRRSGFLRGFAADARAVVKTLLGR
jgi:putative flavoprotein involved in K+ transport